MPLSTDKQVLETSNGLVDTLRGMAGEAPHSFRPGVFAGTTKVVCLFQGFLLFGSEQPIRMKICISSLYLQLPYSLRPLMMTSLSVISILIPTCVASDEARSGSVILYAEEKSPFIKGCSHFFFCSGVQYLASSSMFPVSGAWQFSV